MGMPNVMLASGGMADPVTNPGGVGAALVVTVPVPVTGALPAGVLAGADALAGVPEGGADAGVDDGGARGDGWICCRLWAR